MKKTLFLLVICSLLNCAAGTYTVKPGDTLWSISQNHNTKVETLKSLNGLHSNTITTGQKIKITANGKTHQGVKSTPSPLTNPKWKGLLSRIDLSSWFTALFQGIPEPKVKEQPQVKPIRWIEALPRADRPAQTFLTVPKVRGINLKKTNIKKDALPSLFHKNLTLQVHLDRAGFSPGVIDGKVGHFTRQALQLCPESALEKVRPFPATKTTIFQSSWHNFVNPTLPLTPAGQPDFHALTSHQMPMLYASIEEMIAERYHCKVSLLKKLNPHVVFSRITPGQKLTVPNVVGFDIERYYSAKTSEGLWTKALGKGRPSRHIYVNKDKKILTLWEGDTILRSFPVTVNEQATPSGKRKVNLIAPAPLYKRSKTKLLLMAGPNSPVGIVWCAIGNGYGIHGTNNPDLIGRTSSSGCVRLANWDIVRLAGMIRVDSPVTIIEDSSSLNTTTSEIAHR